MQKSMTKRNGKARNSSFHLLKSCVSAFVLVLCLITSFAICPVLFTLELESDRTSQMPMVRLLMQWDIKMGREQDFSEFVVREFAPRLMQLGIEPSEVLYTMYGQGPQMLTLGVVESKEKLEEILRSPGWKKLHEKLLTYVTNYSHKAVPDNGRNFQL